MSREAEIKSGANHNNQHSSGLSYVQVAWLVWLPFAIFISWQALVYQIRFLGKSGPNFYWALLALIISVPLLLLLWHDVRKLGIAKYEGWLMAAIPLVTALLFEPKAVFTVVCVGIGSFAIGRRLLRYLDLSLQGPVEEIAVSASIGLGVFHMVLFGAGLAGWYFPIVFAALVVAPIAFCWREAWLLRNLVQRIVETWPSLPGMGTWSGTVFSAFSLVFVAPAIMVALAPSVYFDMVRIHLPAVAFNLAHHALQVPPYLQYAYFPQSVETVMTMSSALAGQAGAQLAPLLYVVLALLALFRVGRVCGFDGFQSLTGTLAAISVPAFHWTADSGKNDLALALFVLLALLAYLRWEESREFNWIWVGVFCVAMAAGVKHIALFAVLPLGVLYAYAACRQPNPFRAFIQLAGILLFFGSMWFLRSWLATGNPVFPSAVAAAAESGTRVHRSWWNMLFERDLQFPWRVHFHGMPYFESTSQYPMGIALVVFLPMWLLIRTSWSAALRTTLFFCAAYLVYWLNAIAMIRYAIAPLALLFLFTWAYTVRFVRQSSTLTQATVLVAAVYTLVFSTCGVLINEVSRPQVAYFAHRIGKTEYLREALLPYPALEKIDALAGRSDRVLSLDSCLLAYASNPSLFDCRLLNEVSWESILQQMKAEDYRFVMAPSSVTSKIPPDWNRIYSDKAFTVYTKPQRVSWNKVPVVSY